LPDSASRAVAGSVRALSSQVVAGVEGDEEADEGEDYVVDAMHAGWGLAGDIGGGSNEDEDEDEDGGEVGGTEAPLQLGGWYEISVGSKVACGVVDEEPYEIRCWDYSGGREGIALSRGVPQGLEAAV